MDECDVARFHTAKLLSTTYLYYNRYKIEILGKFQLTENITGLLYNNNVAIRGGNKKCRVARAIDIVVFFLS